MKKRLVLLIGAAVMAGVALAGTTIARWQNWPSPFQSQAAIPEAAVDEPSDVALAPEAEVPTTKPATAEQTVPEANPADAEDTLEQLSGERENLAAVDPTAPGLDAAVQPSFDVVRIEDDGSLIAAGRAGPDSEVSLLLNGKEIGSVAADEIGEWLIIPADPLPPGNHQLTAEASDTAGSAVNSSNIVALAVPQREAPPPQSAVSVAPPPPQANEERGERIAPTPDAAPLQAGQQEAGAPDAEQSGAPAVEVAVAPQPDMEPEQQADQVSGSDVPLALESVDYDEQGDIVFSGRAGSGRTVRVYIDNRLLGETTADADGRWQFGGRDQITPGRHTLRADLLGATGEVFGRLLLPFVRAGSREVAALIESRRDAADSQETAGPGNDEHVSEAAEAATETEAVIVDDEAAPNAEQVPAATAEEKASEPESGASTVAEAAESEPETGPALVAEDAAPEPESATPDPVEHAALEPEADAPAGAEVTPEPALESPLGVGLVATVTDPEAVAPEQVQHAAPEPEGDTPAVAEVAPEPGPEVPVVREQAGPEPEPEARTVVEQDAPEPEHVVPALAMPEPVQASENPTVAATRQKPAPDAAPAARGHVVIQPGNNLWRISRVIYGRGIEYIAIYEANRDQIRDPDLIYPGQIFATPGVNPPSEINPDWRGPLGPEELAGRNDPE